MLAKLIKFEFHIFQLNLEIRDENDNRPKFGKSLYVLRVLQTGGPNTVIGEVSAADPDQSAVITYSIVSGNEDGKIY